MAGFRSLLAFWIGGAGIGPANDNGPLVTAFTGRLTISSYSSSFPGSTMSKVMMRRFIGLGYRGTR